MGFSGGGDSLALLLTVSAWAAGAGRPVLALTVDHRLNPLSARWTEAAESVARGLGADFRSLAWEGPKPARGLPAAARLARHHLLAEAARKAGARVLLLGHTRDDVLEAGLMRAAGSSVGAPRAWSPSPVWPEGRDLFLLRPLLGVRREALREMLTGERLEWLDDPANDDLAYSRARARASLSSAHPGESRDPGFLAAAQQSCRPNVSSTETHQKHLGPGFRRDERGLEDLGRVATTDHFGIIRISYTALADANPDDARRFISIACLCAGGGGRPPRTERTERLRHAVAASESFTATLAGARIEADHQAVVFMRDAGETARGGLAPAELTAGQPGVWDGRFEITASSCGLEVFPLKGSAARLPSAERAMLAAVPPAARVGLPVVNPDVGKVTCPILAPGVQVSATSLIGARLRGACGLIGREYDVAAAPDGGRVHKALS